MDATQLRGLQVARADHRPRSGEGPLAEEAIYGRASHAARQPEAALMCAILADAVGCFQQQFVFTATRRAKRLGEEAKKWLFSDDFDWTFSFQSICAALDLCPQYIRQGLTCWHERGPQLRTHPATNGYLKSIESSASPSDLKALNDTLCALQPSEVDQSKQVNQRGFTARERRANNYL